MLRSYTSSFRSIISIKNSLFNSELSSGMVTPLSCSRYSARRIGDCKVLYALFMSELQSADRLCSTSLLEVINSILSVLHRWVSEHQATTTTHFAFAHYVFLLEIKTYFWLYLSGCKIFCILRYRLTTSSRSILNSFFNPSN